MSLDVASPALPSETHPKSAPPGRQIQRSTQPLVIGPDVSLTGVLQVDGELRLEGRIEADVRCQTLVVSPLGKIDGVIVADCVEISGHVKGEIYSNRVIIKKDGHVEAELNYRSLELKPGGYFDGRSRRHPSPISLSPSFPPAN